MHICPPFSLSLGCSHCDTIDGMVILENVFSSGPQSYAHFRRLLLSSSLLGTIRFPFGRNRVAHCGSVGDAAVSFVYVRAPMRRPGLAGTVAIIVSSCVKVTSDWVKGTMSIKLKGGLEALSPSSEIS